VNFTKDHVDTKIFFSKFAELSNLLRKQKMPVLPWKHVFCQIWCDFWNQQTQKWWNQKQIIVLS